MADRLNDSSKEQDKEKKQDDIPQPPDKDIKPPVEEPPDENNNAPIDENPNVPKQIV